MGSNHFDDIINGCPGGQFIQPPAFAWWTIFPCLRWQIISYILRIPRYLLMLPLGILAFCLGLVGAILACVSLPITFPIYCIRKELWKSSPIILFLLQALCYLFIIPLGILIFCLGFVLSFALLPITLPFFCCYHYRNLPKCDFFDIFQFIYSCCAESTFFMILLPFQLIWLPIPIILTLLLLPFYLLFTRESFCDFIDELTDDRPLMYWALPFYLFQSLLMSYFGDDD